MTNLEKFRLSLAEEGVRDFARIWERHPGDVAIAMLGGGALESEEIKNPAGRKAALRVRTEEAIVGENPGRDRPNL